MIEIRQPTIKDAELLSEIGARSFIESHGLSASKEDIDDYVARRYAVAEFEKDLSDPSAVYRLVSVEGKPIAYSKIIYLCTNPNIKEINICKMERLYVLKDYYDLKIGKQLFDYNVELAKANMQIGMWLYVWTENRRALRFYEKQGFKNIGTTSFKISETHSNPNYWMYLRF